MKNARQNPDAIANANDDLSDLEEMIMLGDVKIDILKLYNAFKQLGGTPSPAMRQRVEEALEKLAIQQNVPAPSVGAPHPATVTHVTTAQDRAESGENVSSPSTDNLQSKSKYSTTSSNKVGPSPKSPAPSVGALKSKSSRTATTVVTQEAPGPSKKAPQAEDKVAYYVSAAKSVLEVATPVVTCGLALWQNIAAEKRAEASRLQDVAVKTEIDLLRSREKQNELQASVTKTWIEAGAKLAAQVYMNRGAGGP